MKKNSITTVASINSLVSGLKKRQPKGLFLIAGAKYTSSQLVTILQSIVTSMLAVPVAKGAYLKAVKASDALLEQHNAAIVQLKQSLQMQASDDTALLADYGLTPRKPSGVRSPRTQVAAADKAKATRVARHTMGSKQKLQITGASVAPAAQAASGITNVAMPISVPPVVTPPATASPVATGIPIVAALSSATPLVTSGH